MILLHIISNFGAIDVSPLPKPSTTNIIPNVLKLVFGIAGAICLLIVTLSGFKYTISQGNPQQTAQAKNSIIYALVGLIVVIISSAIVSFVLDKV